MILIHFEHNHNSHIQCVLDSTDACNIAYTEVDYLMYVEGDEKYDQ